MTYFDESPVGSNKLIDLLSHVAYYLPKDDGDYQFCYVDSNGQVRGASTPFCFENPQDHVLYTSLENDILVISTKVDINIASSTLQTARFVVVWCPQSTGQHHNKVCGHPLIRI